MASDNVSFPAPVGGVPFELDFGPSILFACLYAMLVLLSIYRMSRSATRITVVWGTFAFVVERVVIWALRAKQAKTPSEDLDRNLTIYWQMTFATGYISMYADLVTILRCLVVNTTKGDARSDDGHGASAASLSVYGKAQDQPRARFWYRRTFGVLIIASWVPFVLGVVMGTEYVKAETNAGTAATVQNLRYATSAVAFVLILCVLALAAWAAAGLRSIKRSAALLALAVATLLLVIPVYHFVVMHHWTTSLVSTAPGSQNTAGEKALFYVFQAAPEVLSAGILLVVDVKSVFGTGMWGDRSTDAKKLDEKV